MRLPREAAPANSRTGQHDADECFSGGASPVKVGALNYSCEGWGLEISGWEILARGTTTTWNPGRGVRPLRSRSLQNWSRSP